MGKRRHMDQIFTCNADGCGANALTIAASFFASKYDPDDPLWDALRLEHPPRPIYCEKHTEETS